MTETSRWAVIDGGIVTNIILADADFAGAIGAVPAKGAQIGWTWDGQDFHPPLPIPKTREDLKAERQAAVENITVTTAAGNTFDGDETSQTRMARAILVLSTGVADHVPWVLADNSIIQADIAELTEALAKAGAAQAALWLI